jgi:putative copper resistance protein D
MEHSTLHALQLIGLLAALGGPCFVLGLLRPAARALGADAGRDVLRAGMEEAAARWVLRGALAGAAAGLLDFFVLVAEAQGQTVFGGVSLAEVWRFMTTTVVGQLNLARVALLAAAGAAAALAGRAKWWLAGAFGAAAMCLASLVSHAGAEPAGRAAALVPQLAHLAAGAIWIGTLMHLLASRRLMEAATPSQAALVAELVRRFSPVAMAAAAGLAISGGVAAWRFLGSPGAVLASAYGLTMLVKLALILPVLAAGYTNFSVVRPGLLAAAAGRAAQDAGGVLRRFGRMLELEVTAGVLVIAVAGILGSVSPPREDGGVLLTETQKAALLSPDAPRARLIDPAAFYGAPMRTVEDLLYSEFTHNWSGVMVALLGLCWLAQTAGAAISAQAARVWPLLLVPFAGFVAVAADPEVWVLRRLTFAEVIRDPQIWEHQIGALMIVLMIWLGWRDARRPAAERPLGYALPAIMILGSLLLLGHAHSNLNATQELTNIINVQHAVLGGLGLFSGSVRWLSLRGLFPERVARVAWPALVVALGLFMAFFYREVY